MSRAGGSDERAIDRRTQTGGDPRGLPDYQALCKEIARLSHPACPDVDWRTVERCCLSLFTSNGADLQTASAYALARSHLGGLEGMSEGVTVLDTLLRADGEAWPRGVAARADILGRLFGQWQVVLREMEIDAGDLADLGPLNGQLERLRLILPDQKPVAISALERLRQQIAERASRIEREAQAVAVAAQNPRQNSSSHPPAQRHPSVRQPTPSHIRPAAKKRRGLGGVLLAAALFCLIVALAWT